MRTSEKHGTIAAALYAVHRDLENPRKDAKGQVRGRADYRYLSLPALIDHAKAALKEAQVAVIQDVTGDRETVAVSTTFLHLTGEWVEVGPLVMPAPADPQQRGSALTYARRYALAAALNLAADEDDDAQSAKLEPRGTVAEVRVAPGMVKDDGAGSAAYGEGAAGSAPTTPEGEAPSPGAASTPSGQPDGHHEHTWAPSPTMPGWRWCTVRGCGKAEKAPKEAPV